MASVEEGEIALVGGVSAEIAEGPGAQVVRPWRVKRAARIKGDFWFGNINKPHVRTRQRWDLSNSIANIPRGGKPAIEHL
jgi:hypothetical protein